MENFCSNAQFFSVNISAIERLKCKKIVQTDFNFFSVNRIITLVQMHNVQKNLFKLTNFFLQLVQLNPKIYSFVLIIYENNW